jgi:hypothetical protein
MKTSTVHSLALAAAIAGLIGGTSVRVNAQTIQKGDSSISSASMGAGVLVLADNQSPNLPKHSCKGKNDCKGQGGGKHPGKNSCKGKGDCATDGSKPNFV